MCYVVLLSTTSGADLGRYDSELLHFERELPEAQVVAALKYPNRWFVGSKSGCSCTFRHLHATELGFGPPVDWYPEEDDEVAGTLEFVAVVRHLVEAGERVDCIDAWSGEAAADPAVLEVDLGEVADAEFRFFEDRHFDFTPVAPGVASAR